MVDDNAGMTEKDVSGFYPIHYAYTATSPEDFGEIVSFLKERYTVRLTLCYFCCWFIL